MTEHTPEQHRLGLQDSTPSAPTVKRKTFKKKPEEQRTTAQQLGSIIKSARDIMRKDKGLNGDLDRLPMLTWVLFLKFLDDAEQFREADAALRGEAFRPGIEPPYRWRNWAARDEGITGEELIRFIDNEEAHRPDGTQGPGLFAYLRGLTGAEGGDRRDVIATVFRGVSNRMQNGYLLRDVINKVDQIHFNSSEEIHTLGRLYESLLREMRDAAGDSGEFYTPRPVVQFMVEVMDPRLGETVLDPACGTGGFLVEAFEHLRKQCRTVEDHTTLQNGSIQGGEAKSLPYLLAQMNLLLHKELALRMAVCFGNSLGGTVVFGIRNKAIGRQKAVVGIDFAPDLDAIRGSLYDSIDPKLPVQFEWLLDEARRLLLMHVPSINPPYTTTDGQGWMRIGKDCKPLTGSLRHQVHERAGLADPTREFVPLSDPMAGISPAALELLRREMREAGAPDDQTTRPDRELCVKLGMIRDGRLTLGGLVVAGREELLAEHAPNHEWKYSRMRSDVELDTLPVTGRESILVALDKLKLVLAQQNPITTLESDFFHTEFPRYPVLALREALLNAFVHRDYTIPGMVFIRHWNDRVEINSPGGFVDGVTPQNILHHPPVTRNRYLVDTILTATRLVNRQNMGVPRIFKSLLEEGKEPPRFEEVGQTVRLTFPGQEVDQAFRRLIRFVVETQEARLDADTLLLLHFFRRRQEAEWTEIREAYPYNDRQLREKLAFLENDVLAIEHSGSGDTRIYRLSRRAAAILAQGTTDELTRRFDKEAMKSRILALLRDRPLRNKEVRAFTDLDRQQVTAIMQELAQEGLVRLDGFGVGARWYLVNRVD